MQLFADFPRFHLTPQGGEVHYTMKIEQETFKVNVRVTLLELIGTRSENWMHQFEHFESFLEDKIAFETDDGSDAHWDFCPNFIICSYFICDHQSDAVIFTVEGYKEE